MTMRFTMNNLSSFLFTTLLLVKIYTLLQLIPTVHAEGTDASSSLLSMTTTCDESLTAPIVLPCPDPVLLRMSYVSGGAVDCGGALTLEQAAISPRITADFSIVDPDSLYSLILVDTMTTTAEDTFFSLERHPILHYGAANIQGSTLLAGLSLDRTDQLDVFFTYRGPKPPEPNGVGATPRIENTLFAYQYMLAAQPQKDMPIDIPELSEGSVLQFDYIGFFQDTVGVEFANLLSSTYFLSGLCVKKPAMTTISGRQDPSEPPSEANASPTVLFSAAPTATPVIDAESNGESDESSSETKNEISADSSTDSSASAATSGEGRTFSVAVIEKTGLALGVVIMTWLSYYF